MQELVSPYRKEDGDEVMEIIKTNGGMEKIASRSTRRGRERPRSRGAYWRLEGPGFVWSFRALPHIHTFVNISSKLGEAGRVTGEPRATESGGLNTVIAHRARAPGSPIMPSCPSASPTCGCRSRSPKRTSPRTSPGPRRRARRPRPVARRPQGARPPRQAPAAVRLQLRGRSSADEQAVSAGGRTARRRPGRVAHRAAVLHARARPGAASRTARSSSAPGRAGWCARTSWRCTATGRCCSNAARRSTTASAT